VKECWPKNAEAGEGIEKRRKKLLHFFKIKPDYRFYFFFQT
jgi:hypothetical protein